MVVSKSYNAVAGQNFIQSTDLVFATIYVVKRSGVQHDPYIIGSINRTYIHEESTGKIFFTDGFNSGETVFVMFEGQLTTAMACEPVAISSLTTTDAKVGTAYIRTYSLTGTAPYDLIVITKPAWSTVTLFGGHFVRLTGTPIAEGTEILNFTVGNCSGTELAAINDTFEVLPADNNLFISNVFFTRINSVTGISYTITTGFFPMLGGPIPLTAVHGAYTGVINVNVSNIIFPRTLTLKKNGDTVETIPVPVNGTYIFASQTYLSTDVINITLT